MTSDVPQAMLQPNLQLEAELFQKCHVTNVGISTAEGRSPAENFNTGSHPVVERSSLQPGVHIASIFEVGVSTNSNVLLTAWATPTRFQPLVHAFFMERVGTRQKLQHVTESIVLQANLALFFLSHFRLCRDGVDHQGIPFARRCSKEGGHVAHV
eukprot:CAMPEP_0170604676 /NCGR_PEP_ID=MMETSP0224-20130122/19552_1 /TAXON_ID=285029 /ORGANISM="Togula jolla, Strain CCCM 725" /LENGTH=154 /DNA_ID=CAMNT_0010929599 /DNA_START=80 /DNA_END=544 /DNA_ORIENTATION=+